MLELCTVFCVQKSYIYTPTGDRIGHARVVAKSRRTMKDAYLCSETHYRK